MRAIASILVALGLAIALAADPAVARASEADLSVAQTAHQGQTLWPVGPEHTGPIPISPDPGLNNGEYGPWAEDYVTFLSVVTNNGPDTATVTFTRHMSGLDDQPGYTYWTGPVANTQAAWQGDDPDGCTPNSFRCHFSLAPGHTYELLYTVRGNAPGTYTLYNSVSSPLADPDPTNNQSEIFSEPVVCSITGTSGDDTLTGTTEFDSICGLGGNDRIMAVGSLDKVFGGAGKDLIGGQSGSQQFVGGRGIDTITYAGAPRAIRLSLADRGSTGWGYDTLLSIENVVGTRFNDYIEGSGAPNTLVGRGGNDRLFGRGSSDVLMGGSGLDNFISRDTSRDVVYGGTGFDSAYRDSRDIVRSSLSVAAPGFADLYIPPPSGGG